MKELLTRAIKKVTLELIYEVVDERTSKILDRLEKIERRQEEDFRYLNDKQEEGFRYLNDKMDAHFTQLNQRIDTIMQLLVSRQKHD
jgi:hypothetical protein